jgi:hypothetical protein
MKRFRTHTPTRPTGSELSLSGSFGETSSPRQPVDVLLNPLH